MYNTSDTFYSQHHKKILVLAAIISLILFYSTIFSNLASSYTTTKMFNSPLTFNDLSRSTNSQNQQSTMAGQTPNQEGTSYLPGYLSSAARGSNIPLSTPPRQSQSGQPAQSSLSRSPLSTSQSSAHQGHSQSVSGGAFGAGSLFGSM